MPCAVLRTEPRRPSLPREWQLVAAGFALALGCWAPQAHASCTKATEFRPRLCPSGLPAVRVVHVAHMAGVVVDGPGQGPPAGADCAAFKPTARTVRRFFARAMQASESDAHHTLDVSPCGASGTLTLADGRTARWSLNEFQTGALDLVSGERMFLYCPACTFKPFKW